MIGFWMIRLYADGLVFLLNNIGGEHCMESFSSVVHLNWAYSNNTNTNLITKTKTKKKE